MSTPAKTEHNPFGVAKRESSVVASVQEGRDAQQIQSALIIAQRFPRDEERAYTKIIVACKRMLLAESAIYSYPKGGQQIEGPSIRLAECIATNWGNMRTGWFEIDQREGESQICAYAWDLQTNNYKDIVFKVKHSIYTKQGDKRLTDPREIYEHCANQASRRVRNCILAIVPGDMTEAAVNQCNETMKAGDPGESIVDRVRKMLVAFAEIGVTQVMIEKFLGHKSEACSNIELVTLRKRYASIRDGHAKREDFFDAAADDMPKPNIKDDAKSETKSEGETKSGETKSETKEPPKEPPKDQQPPEPTTGKKEPTTQDPKANMLALRLLLEKAGLTELHHPTFLKWLKHHKIMGTVLPALDQLENFPRKIADIVANWEEFRPALVEYIKANSNK